MSDNYNRSLSVDPSILRDPKIYAPALDEFCVPSLLSDLMCYIEVGQIKISTIKCDNCQYIELWVSPCLTGKKIREECKNPKRRQIYSVLVELEELCREQDTCVLIMDDDNTNGTDAFYKAIYPIVVYLHLLKYIKAVILFTKLPHEKILKPDTVKFFQPSDEYFHKSLYNTVDAYISNQPNCYTSSTDRTVKINNKKCSVYVSKAIHVLED